MYIFSIIKDDKEIASRVCYKKDILNFITVLTENLSNEEKIKQKNIVNNINGEDDYIKSFFNINDNSRKIGFSIRVVISNNYEIKNLADLSLLTVKENNFDFLTDIENLKNEYELVNE